MAHLVVAALALAGMVWHAALTSLPGLVIAGVALCLWLPLVLYRGIRLFQGGRGKVARADELEGATAIQVQVPRGMTLFPGCFFNVFFPDQPRLGRFVGYRSYAWYWRGRGGKEAIRGEAAGADAGDGLYLLLPSDRYPGPVREGTTLYLDGPYGVDVRPELYETVVLVAQGSGITAALSFALTVADTERRKRFTTRVDLLWKLDEREQKTWAAGQLNNMFVLDPLNKLVASRTYYRRSRAAFPDGTSHSRPGQPGSEPRWDVQADDHARYHKFEEVSSDDDCMQKIQDVIKARSQRAGRTIVIVCGEAYFREKVRDFVYASHLTADLVELANEPSRRIRHHAGTCVPGRRKLTAADIRVIKDPASMV